MTEVIEKNYAFLKKLPHLGNRPLQESDFQSLKEVVKISRSPALRQLKSLALERIQELGIPGAKTESTGYIPELLLEKWTLLSDISKDFIKYISDSSTNEYKAPANLLPPGVESFDSQKLSESSPQHFKKILVTLEEEQDSLSLLGFLFCSDIVALIISKETTFSNPLDISSILSHTGPGVQLFCFLEPFSSSDFSSLFPPSPTQSLNIPLYSGIHFYLESSARCSLHQHLFAQNHQHQSLGVHLKENANFTGTQFTETTGCIRQSLKAKLTGRGSHFSWNNGSLGLSKGHIHHYLQLLHEVPDTSSHQLFRNILLDQSRHSVDGTVAVAPDAQQTNSNQLIQNLLLSPQVKADNKPNLMIFADDVKCTHGATSGQMNEEEKFYLQSRGLTPEEAKTLLTESFLTPILNTSHHSEWKNQIRHRLQSVLKSL